MKKKKVLVWNYRGSFLFYFIFVLNNSIYILKIFLILFSQVIGLIPENVTIQIGLIGRRIKKHLKLIYILNSDNQLLEINRINRFGNQLFIFHFIRSCFQIKYSPYFIENYRYVNQLKIYFFSWIILSYFPSLDIGMIIKINYDKTKYKTIIRKYTYMHTARSHKRVFFFSLFLFFSGE